MNGRELYPDAEERRRIMDFIMAAGQTLLETARRSSSVEQTMEIMALQFPSAGISCICIDQRHFCQCWHGLRSARCATCPPARPIWAGWLR